MTDAAPDTDDLLRLSALGRDDARQGLLARHRDRLKHMVEVRLDPRLRARLDPSDVVQEALAEASARLDEYLLTRPVAFYPWLRQIAWQRLVKLHEHHRARKRDARREAAEPAGQGSAEELARLIADTGTGPSAHVLREEARRRVREALEGLGESDRDLLTMRHLEHLSPGEIAQVLGIAEGAVKTRLTRALRRLQAAMAGEGEP